MPYFKVGGQVAFVTIVRAKDEDRAEAIAIGHAYREGSMYFDCCAVEPCDADGNPVEGKV